MKKRNKNIPCPLHPDPEHWVRKGDTWKVKVTYESEEDAWEFLNQNSKLKESGCHPYLCKVCSKWHIGR